MQVDINVLKSLLNKLLENKLERLEIRNKEQIEDLKCIKYTYEKQQELLNKLSNKNTPNTNVFSNSSKTLSLMENKRKINLRKFNSEPKRINSILEEIPQNTNQIKKEKKRIIISSIDLNIEEINFILEEKKKREEINDNEDNGSNSERDISNKKRKKIYCGNSSSCSYGENNKNKQKCKVVNKETVEKFGKYINSCDGKDIALLICSFLDKNSKFNFLSCSKLLIRQLAYYIDDVYQNIFNINNISSLNSIESRINDIKNKYKGEDFDSPKYEFTLSSYTVKSLDLLDDSSYNTIFTLKNLEPPLDQIIFIYRVFFQLIVEEKLIDIENDKKFWEKTRNFILERNNNQTGTFIRNYISEFDFTCKNIYKLKILISGKERRLRPSIYENINETTGLISFIVKDSLEYCGLIPNKKRIILPSIVINYLEYLNKIIKRTKEYLDILKKY